MPMNPDGWKDEEGDVTAGSEDNFFKSNSDFKQVKDWIRSPDTSAQPCGCDIGARWVCMRHRKPGE